MKFLEEADINYGNAIVLKPGQMVFAEAQQRVRESIDHYRKVEQSRLNASEHRGAPRGKTLNQPAAVADIAKGAASPGSLNIDRLISCKSVNL